MTRNQSLTPINFIYLDINPIHLLESNQNWGSIDDSVSDNGTSLGISHAAKRHHSAGGKPQFPSQGQEVRQGILPALPQ